MLDQIVGSKSTEWLSMKIMLNIWSEDNLNFIFESEMNENGVSNFLSKIALEDWCLIMLIIADFFLFWIGFRSTLLGWFAHSSSLRNQPGSLGWHSRLSYNQWKSCLILTYFLSTYSLLVALVTPCLLAFTVTNGYSIPSLKTCLSWVRTC